MHIHTSTHEFVYIWQHMHVNNNIFSNQMAGFNYKLNAISTMEMFNIIDWHIYVLK